MGELGNIIIAGESALHLHLHCDGPASIGARVAMGNPLEACASTAEGLAAFNTEHPLFGEEPVTVLVSDSRSRRVSSSIRCKCCTHELPNKSFLKLRDGLFVTSPQLAFVQAALTREPSQIAEIGTNLCARYYARPITGKGADRSAFLVTPDELRRYLDSVRDMRGAAKARRALQWIAPNSGSPMETKSWLQFRLPCHLGGFGLPFDALNYDISARRLSGLTLQQDFSIDIVCSKKRFGLEYDGHDFHEDASKDKRRRNELLTLGWTVFPIDKQILLDPEATERVAYQIAHHLHHRLRLPENWEVKYTKLRHDLNLPC